MLPKAGATVTAITSTVGSRSYGFYTFTKSYNSVEISGEDGQTNIAGAHPTGSDLQQQQEWWNQMPLPDDQTQEARLLESNARVKSSLWRAGAE